MISLENKTLEELNSLENDYIARNWYNGGSSEFDMEINDIARAKIIAVKRKYGTCFLARFHPQEGQANPGSYFIPYEGQNIYNFDYDIAVPVEDEELRRLLALFLERQSKAIITRIFGRVSEVGGVMLMWV